MENYNDDFICFKCKHYKLISIGCDAFPDGIPNEILLTNNHDDPLKDQDNTIVFEEGEPKME
jgi:hypothetical protein